MAVTSIPFRYALVANSESTGFTAFVSTATEPSGAGVFDLMSEELSIGHKGYAVPTYLQLIPFGTNGDNDTFDMRLYGYNATQPANLETDTAIYIPQLL